MEQPDIHLDEDEPTYEPSMDVDQDVPNTNGTAGNSQQNLFEDWSSLRLVRGNT